MEISDVDPSELEIYLTQIAWPANKETVVEGAREGGAPEDLLQDMRRSLSGRNYSGSAEVADNMRH